MPNELNIALSTGLTVTAQRYQNGAAVGSAISLSEVGSSGFYTGNMTGAAGTYQLAFLAAGANVGAGSIIWDGTNEVAISTLTQAGVQSALTAQGITTARAGNLDNLDATVSSRLAPSGTLATVTNLTNAPASGPSAASVASAVWSAAARTITGGTVDTLTNAPTVPSAAAIATQVWAVADKTGYSLTSAERSAIAAAVEASILNEGDGQAILNAIVTAIGNSNVDQVALVAAIRTELERNGGNLSAIKAKTDNLPAAPAAIGDIPTESEIAAAVWSKPTTELTISGSIGERAKNQSTVSTTGAQLAAALS